MVNFKIKYCFKIHLNSSYLFYKGLSVFQKIKKSILLKVINKVSNKIKIEVNSLISIDERRKSCFKEFVERIMQIV